MKLSFAAAKNLLNDARLAAILELLNGNGEETRLVGGAVRNALIGLPVHEYDLATTALPDVVSARAKAANIKCIPTGIDHGTVTLVFDGMPFEVTSLREDIDTDGRHAVVRFGRDFVADAWRRDFTINALSMRADGEICDYTYGIDDLRSHRVRFIGEAEKRIEEDYLRILRFFRFSAVFGRELDPQGLRAAITHRAGLERLSRERVRAELMKILIAPHMENVVSIMSGIGILGPLLGGVAYAARLQRFCALETAHGTAPDAVLRLGALAVKIPEDATRLRELLRLSNEEADRLTKAANAAVVLHGAASVPNVSFLREYLFTRGKQAALDGFRLHQVDACAPSYDASFASAYAFLHDTPEPRLPFTGKDLLARGIAPGRGVGEILKKLQARWIREGFPKDANTIARLLEDVMNKEPN